MSVKDEVASDADRVASSAGISVELPAGAGKTHLIATAVSRSPREGKRILILTHTHAGVAVLKQRLRELAVPSVGYSVETIDGFASKYALSFPSVSGVREDKWGEREYWGKVRCGAAKSLRNPHIAAVVEQTYSDLYVDEYQDCGRSQHALVRRLSELVPARVFGDRLQGIFDFDESDPKVDWARDVESHFKPLSVTTRPWRWEGFNPDLGQWLREVRECLINRKGVAFTPSTPLKWNRYSPQAALNSCHSAARDENSSVVVIRAQRQQCYGFSKKLSGRYSAMEELGASRLMILARDLDEGGPAERVLSLIDFARNVRTKLPGGPLRRVEEAVQGRRSVSLRKNQRDYNLLARILEAGEADDRELLIGVMRAFEEGSSFCHRREAWYEMKRALRVWLSESKASTCVDAVRLVRDRTRRRGRIADKRVVSTPLLVKGLEYDHAVLVNADEFKHPAWLYVAITRGRKSLSLLSSKRSWKGRM